MTAPRTCPQPKCDRTVPYGHLACRDHWFGVPSALRKDLSRAWNSGSPGPEYRAARQACIDFLETWYREDRDV